VSRRMPKKKIFPLSPFIYIRSHYVCVYHQNYHVVSALTYTYIHTYIYEREREKRQERGIYLCTHDPGQKSLRMSSSVFKSFDSIRVCITYVWR